MADRDDDGCLCRPIGFLLGLPFMLLSALLSLVGIVVWIIATLLICIFPCGVCLAAVVSFAIWLIKLPIKIITWFTRSIPCWSSPHQKNHVQQTRISLFFPNPSYLSNYYRSPNPSSTDHIYNVRLIANIYVVFSYSFKVFIVIGWKLSGWVIHLNKGILNFTE